MDTSKKDYRHTLYGRHYTYVVGNGEWYQNMKVADLFLDPLLNIGAAIKVVYYNDVGKAKMTVFESDTTLLFNRGFVDFTYTSATMPNTDSLIKNVKNRIDITNADNIVHALSLEKGLMLCINQKERLIRFILINACTDNVFFSKLSKRLEKNYVFDSVIKVDCEGTVLEVWKKDAP